MLSIQTFLCWYCHLIFYSYRDAADEPDSSNRVIVFTISDGNFSSSSSLILSISTTDDHPTLVSVDGSGQYSYIEGNSTTELVGILLDDDDSINSDVIVNRVTIAVVGGASNEILDTSFNIPNITVSNITYYNEYIYFNVLHTYTEVNSRASTGTGRASIPVSVPDVATNLTSFL